MFLKYTSVDDVFSVAMTLHLLTRMHVIVQEHLVGYGKQDNKPNKRLSELN